MLSVKLICVGKMKERFYLDAFAEYRKRLQSLCRLELVEPAEQRLPENPSPAEITAALFVEGGQMPSEGMAELIRERENSGKPKLCFVIGGSYGLAPAVKARADRRLSMSQMTFPHHLARVMLIEQLYRGFKINEGSRYHK